MSLHTTLHRHNQQVGHRLNAKRMAAKARGLPGAVQGRGTPLAPQGRMGRMGFVSPYASPAPVHFSSDPNAIVTVNVRTIVAPSPNTYQQTGALVTYGGSTLKPGEVQELTQRSDLDLVVAPPMDIESMQWGVDGKVTVKVVGELPANFGSDYINISGCVPEVYNHHHIQATVVYDTAPGGGGGDIDNTLPPIPGEPDNTLPLTPPEIVGTPILNGSGEVGMNIGCSTGTWEPAAASLAYQWQAGGVDIPGATEQLYRVDAADDGLELTCNVTATNEAGSNTVSSENSILGGGPLPTEVPLNTTPPLASGAGTVGTVVNCSPGVWDNQPTEFAYQWQNAGVDIAGATAADYTVALADATFPLTCNVTATNGVGPSAPVASNAITAAAATRGAARGQARGAREAQRRGKASKAQGEVSSTFTYTLPTLQTDPGPATDLGTVQAESSAELGQMATTFFDQGNAISVYVLELGFETNFTARASRLEEWLHTNQRSFYGYLMPRAHGTSADKIKDFENVFKQFQNPEAMTYFWLTVDKEEIDVLDETFKCVVQHVEAPAVRESLNLSDPYGEFTAAAMFYNAMIYRPSSALRISPMAFKFAYGVTPYPTQNNGPLLKSFKDTATNYISTGAEGGIAFNMVYSGVTHDGMDYFNWWWTIDYVQIRVNQDVSNAVINGSNNALAPLYYDQSGIDSLLSTLANSMAACKAFGMVVGPLMMSGLTGDQLQSNIDTGIYEGACNVNAVPFIPYAQANPGHYKIGEYDGLSVLFIPKRGFIHVLITIAASQLVTI